MTLLTRRSALTAIAAATLQQLTVAAEPARIARDELSLPALTAVIKKLSPLAKPFQQTDWSQRNPDEKPQSLDAYIASKPNRPNAERRILYVQPIGELTPTQREVLQVVTELLVGFYALPVKLQEPLGLNVIPESARREHPNAGDQQILSTYVLDKVLKPRRPADAVAVLGITTTDLWPGKNWNFVFGQASLSERVGVWSLARFGNPEQDKASRQRFLERTLKVAAHETGHMFGIRHCVHFQCGMNGSNSLPETDAGPLAFCPECAIKLCWATGTSPADWFAGLVDFAKSHHLDEQTQWEQSLAKLRR